MQSSSYSAAATPSRYIAWALLGVGLLAGIVLLAQETQAGAIINNGVVQLGVRTYGDLNEYGGSSSMTCMTTAVGVRQMSNNADGTACGCTCEGWGAAYGLANAPASVEGGANSAIDGVFGIGSNTITSTASTATVTSQIGVLTVTQQYAPAPATNKLYKVNVTLTNTGASPIDNVTYRRAMDWDIEPTNTQEYSSILSIDPIPSVLTNSCTNGFASNRIVSVPLATSSAGFFGGCSGTAMSCTSSGYVQGPPALAPAAGTVAGIGPVLGCWDTPVGDHGAVFDFNFGGLGAGNSRSFNIYYGVGVDEPDAIVAVVAEKLQVFSLGKCGGFGYAVCTAAVDPVTGHRPGGPNTFIFGFNGLTIPNPTADWDYEFTTTGTQLAPAYAGPYDLTLDPVKFTDHITFPPLDGLVVYRNWTFGDGAYAWEQIPYHPYAEDGVYTVCENLGISRYGYFFGTTLCKDVTVHNRAPKAAFTYVQLEDGRVMPIDTSTDMDGWLVGWHWTFGDLGGYADVKAPGFHVYPLLNYAKIYTVCLVADDDDGASDSTCQDVLVQRGPLESDTDLDGIPDSSDNCAGVANDQNDANLDGAGDVCEPGYDPGYDPMATPAVKPIAGPQGDRDLDSIADSADNCPTVPNREQGDLDGDAMGDACDADLDGDGVANLASDAKSILDNCPAKYNPNQADDNGNRVGDACDTEPGLVSLKDRLAPTVPIAGPVADDSQGATPAPTGFAALVDTPEKVAGVIAVASILALLAVGITLWSVRRWKA